MSDSPPLPMAPSPWYKDGLKFQCTGCGRCCTGTSGYVWVTDEEIRSMAALFKLSEQKFKMRYVRNVNNRLALIEKRSLNGEYDCVFLNDNKCQIYQARPLQCRTFPWWQENLNSEESWKLAALECEGINDQAPLIPASEIEDALKFNQN